jgi:DNA-binding response OmpR family regulator
LALIRSSQPQHRAFAEVQNHAPKILLVAGDRELLELLSYILHRAAFRPTLATSGSDALQLMDELQPDLLVLDLTSVDGPGLEMLKAVRRSSDLPIIVLSTSVSEDDLVQVLELGADDYVTKPIAFRAMLARIRAVLRRQAR